MSFLWLQQHETRLMAFFQWLLRYKFLSVIHQPLEVKLRKVLHFISGESGINIQP